VLVAGGWLVALPASAAAVHHVAVGGSGEACTEAEPCGRISDALSIAVNGDTITVGPGTYAERVQVPSGLAVTIAGAGSATTVIDGERKGVAVSVPPTSTLTLTGTAVINGAAPGVKNDGTLRMERVSLSGSSGGDGAGLKNAGDATVVDSTISGNIASLSGGGIFNLGSLTIRRSTIAGNSVGLLTQAGTAIYNKGRVEMYDSTVTGNGMNRNNATGAIVSNDDNLPSGTRITFVGAHNTIVGNRGPAFADHDRGPADSTVSLDASIVNGRGPDCSGMSISGRYNVLSDDSCGTDPATDVIADPQVADLADNGGPTGTRALAATSPARDAIPAGSGLCAGNDQRGTPRLYLYINTCDIGAYQYVEPAPKLTLDPDGSLPFGTQRPGTTTTRTLTVLNTGRRPLGLARISVAGAGYSVAATTCQKAGAVAPVPPGLDCAIDVSFTPPSGGDLPGTLTLAGNDGDTQDPVGVTKTVHLIGAGVDVGTVPVLAAPPNIAGTAAVGATLTAQPGTWTGTAPINYGFQWQRCTANGADCADISQATRATYQVTGADTGSRLRVQVTARNLAGTGTPAASEPTAVAVTPPGPVNSALPTVTGQATVGATLTAQPGTWTGTAPIRYAYQWQRCTTACAAIGTAGATYRPGAADIGARLRVQVTATDAAGPGAPAISEVTAVVTQPSRPVNRGVPTVTGQATVGGVLTAEPGTWTGTAPIRNGFQWLRCTATGNGCAAITGATKATYRPAAADVGRRLRIRVATTNPLGTGTPAISAATVTIQAVRPTNHGLPTITGPSKIGGVLTAQPGTWTGTAPIRHTFQWLRCAAAGNNCVAVHGATAKTYRQTLLDAGKRLQVRVAAVNAGGTGTATSRPAGVTPRR